MTWQVKSLVWSIKLVLKRRSQPYQDVFIGVGCGSLHLLGALEKHASDLEL